MKRVLVTGASGFVGYQTLKPLVRKGFEVHAVARTGSHDDGDASVRWHEADLLDKLQVERLISEIQPSHLLHSAWYLEPAAFYQSSLNFDWVRASLDLLQEFHASGGRRCVMVGTGYEYDLRYGFCSEDRTPCLPSTTYGRCKHVMQQLLAAYSDVGGLSSAWARLFFLYGPRECPSRLVASVVRALLRGEPALCSSGEQIRDYLHVQDAGAALVDVLDAEVEGVINVGSGTPVTIREIVYSVADSVGRSDLIQMGEIPTRPDSPFMIVADVARVTREVKWQPKFALQDGLLDTLAWWRAQPGLDKAHCNR